MRIRAFENTASDRETYRTLANAFYCSAAVDHSVPAEHFERTFEACVNDNPYCKGYLLYADTTAVGFGLISLTYSNEAGGLVIWLEELFILDEYRSLGFGKAFFEHVYANYPQAVRYRLEVAPTNERAIALYRKLGYTEMPYIQFYTDKALSH